MTETKRTGGSFAAGEWVKVRGGHLVGEVVEARGDGEAREYLVRVPKVVIETAHHHLVPGHALAAATVEDSHRRMAAEHLEYLADEYLSAGRPEDAKRAMAQAVELVEAGRGEERERVVAEAELLAGAKYSVIRDEHGDYHTEYREGERARRDYRPSLDAALALFAEAVQEHEDVDPAPTFEEGPEGDEAERSA